MKTKSFLDTKHIDLYVDTVSKIGYAIWKDFCSEADYKTAILMQEKMIKEDSITLIVCDIRNFKGTTLANAKWTTDEVQPRLYNSSLKKIAYIVGDSVFGNFTLTIINKKFEADGVLHTNAFKDLKSAEEWLKLDFVKVA